MQAHTLINFADGLEARIEPAGDQVRVRLFDINSGAQLPKINFFPTMKAAEAYARGFVIGLLPAEIGQAVKDVAAGVGTGLLCVLVAILILGL